MQFEPTTRPSLLVRLQDSRDDEAWADFLAIYEPVIYSMTRRRGLQDADAREIVQEVLMSVSRSIDRFEPNSDGSFRGWLSRITRNATIDRLRRLSAARETIDASGVQRLLETSPPQSPLESEFDLDHRRQLFRWAATQVRRRTAETNWMAFWKSSVDGQPISEVAKELKLSEGAVYVARCRIIARIRQCIEEHSAE